jgi:hypothetical protein
MEGSTDAPFVALPNKLCTVLFYACSRTPLIGSAISPPCRNSPRFLRHLFQKENILLPHCLSQLLPFMISPREQPHRDFARPSQRFGKFHIAADCQQCLASAKEMCCRKQTHLLFYRLEKN